MGRSSEKFIETREEELDNSPLLPTPTEFLWKEYFTMLGQYYNYKPNTQKNNEERNI
jgi:hypothetical protein|tara:strand:+ start:439 stop:609 length:171 start_codon:yes stop_codon:yes gene_type:complete